MFETEGTFFRQGEPTTHREKHVVLDYTNSTATAVDGSVPVRSGTAPVSTCVVLKGVDVKLITDNDDNSSVGDNNVASCSSHIDTKRESTPKRYEGDLFDKRA